jgi:carbon monoxide dehydrogenase subunit G
MSTADPHLGTLRPTAHRERHIRATPEAIFALLSDPANLAAAMPRISRVEVLSQTADRARVRTHMSLGPLGSIASEGEVSWVAGRELVFRAGAPVAVESRWTLAPDQGGTRAVAEMSIDLTPMLGPLAAFIPPSSVTSMLEPDLDAALAAIARMVE